MSIPLRTLMELWLNEPTETLLESLADQEEFAKVFEPRGPSLDELATGFTELLLLNVFPYASAFLDPWGELNGKRAQELQAIYSEARYSPAAIRAVGGLDHIGLLLGFLEHALDQKAKTLPSLLDWAPIFCLAVEREPSAHSFYKALARQTINCLFSLAGAVEETLQKIPAPQTETFELSPSDEELTIKMVVRQLTIPVRSGWFLSRARLGFWARDLGLPLPFSNRKQIANSLFDAAGVANRVVTLLDWMLVEARAWESTYQIWTGDAPVWAPWGNEWIARIRITIQSLDTLRDQAMLAEGG